MTNQDRARLDRLMNVAQVISATVEEPPVIFGSLGLSLQLHRFRLPNDVDMLLRAAEDVESLVGLKVQTGDGWVEVKDCGPVPFHRDDPGRIAPRGLRVDLIRADGSLDDVVIVDCQASVHRYRLAREAAGTSSLLCHVPLEAIVADKLHSLLRPRMEGRINMRWADLLDIYWAATSAFGPILAADVSRWFSFLFSDGPSRPLHDIEVPDPPREWAASWRKAQWECAHFVPSVSEAHRIFAAFVRGCIPGYVWRSVHAGWE